MDSTQRMTGGQDGGVLAREGLRGSGSLRTLAQEAQQGMANARPRLQTLADRLAEHVKLLHAMVEGARAHLDRIHGQLPPEERERKNAIEGEPASSIALIEALLAEAIQQREALQRQLYRLEAL